MVLLKEIDGTNILFFTEPSQVPLHKMENKQGSEIPLDKMIIAYHCAPNLGNLLSYRKIVKRSGPEVSSYL